MKTCLYRASNLKSTITFLASVSCDLFIIIIIVIAFFKLVFSEYAEANATSLIPLDTIPLFLRFVLLSLVLAVLCELK